MATNTYCLQTKTTRWRRLIISAGLAFAAVFLLSLATSAPAKADCGSVEECDGNANWQRMMANQAFNEGVFLNAAADQHAARGQYNESNMYRELARLKLNEAQIWNIASANSMRRYVFIANSPDGRCGETACAAGIVPEWVKRIGKATVGAARSICNKKWRGVPAGAIACEGVKSVVVDSFTRYVWKLKKPAWSNYRTCMEQRAVTFDNSGPSIFDFFFECRRFQ